MRLVGCVGKYALDRWVVRHRKLDSPTVKWYRNRKLEDPEMLRFIGYS